MNPVPKLYAKIFLLTSLPFGAIIAGIEWIFGDGFSWLKVVLSAFFYGILMASFLILRQQKKLKEMGIEELTVENTRVYQAKQISSTLSQEALTEVLKKDAFTSRMKLTVSENGLLLKTTQTWDSWGEVIRIHLAFEKDGNYCYNVSSRPALRTTLLDYGKGLTNITQMERILAAHNT